MRGALCVATRLYILYLAADESISGWEFLLLIPKSPHNVNNLSRPTSQTLTGTQNISQGRLKPAFLDTARLNVNPQIPFPYPVVTNKPKQTVRRSGRYVRYPKHLYC